MSDWVLVGKLLGPHGVKGWIKLYSHTQPIDNIKKYNPLWIKPEGAKEESWRPVSVEHVQRHGKGLVAKIEGCDNRDQVPTYTGCEVAIKRDQLPALQKDDYYWSDLEGLAVITEQGDCLGKVGYLFETGANDVLVVKATKDSIDSQERLIPYLWQEAVKAVDLDAATITVDWDKEF